MNRQYRPFLVVMLLAVTLTACTPLIHGVPEDRWVRMSETERAAAREVHAERQRQLEIERAEYARREAATAEAC